jgi:hypothetical protein
MSKVIRSVIARTHTAKNIQVNTDDLVTGATLLRRQWELQNTSRNRTPEPESLEQAMRRIVRDESNFDPDKLLTYDQVNEAADSAIEHRLDGASVNLETETGKPVKGNLSTN